MSEFESSEVETVEVPTVKFVEVKPFQNRFRCVFKVIEKSEEKEVSNRNNPEETHRMSDVLVADDTASIILTSWDDDIDFLQVGNYYSLTNGYINIFQNSMRLAKGKYGVLEEVQGESFEVNTEKNRSDEEHQRRPRRRRNFNRRSNMRF